MEYAGDLTPTETWSRLQADPDGVLIDVRTQPEWDFVGVPDLSSINRCPVFLSWKCYPDMQINPAFATTLRTAIPAVGPTVGPALYFLCRSGQRSCDAAVSMTKNGHAPCYNITDGFEGPLGATGRRDVKGWKAEGLPWVQG